MFRSGLHLLLAVCFTITAHAQDHPSVAVDWDALASTTLGQAVEDGTIPGATVIVVDQQGTRYTGSFGVSDVDAQTPVTDTTLFQVGSIGKVLTAIAVLQQVEQGRLGLHTDVNTYLADWQVTTIGDTPLTLHHLLTHSGGLNQRAIGYATRTPEEVTPLGTHLASHFPAAFAPPGRYISYSNYGMGLAGYTVEQVTDTPYGSYVTNEVLRPLEITDSGYQPHATARVAQGYISGGNGLFNPAPAVYRPVTPAGSFIAHARDMGLLMQALLNGGAPILTSSAVAQMTTTQFTMHPDLMGNSYGMEESRWGTLSGFGKGGSIPGFIAYMALLPEQGLGFFVAVNTSSDAAVDAFMLAATDALDHASPAAPRPTVAVDIGRFTGEYRNNRYNHDTIEKLLALEVRELYASSEGHLLLWHDGAMNSYQAVDDLVFQHTENTHRMLVFEEDTDGRITHAYFNDRIAGGYLPVVWERNDFLNSNAYVNEYLGVVALLGLSYLLFPVVALVQWFLRRKRRRGPPHPARLRLHIVGMAGASLLLLFILRYMIPLLQQRPELIFGIPESITPWAVLPIVMIGVFVLYALAWVAALRHSRKAWLGQAYGGLYLVAAVLLTVFFFQWNLV